MKVSCRKQRPPNRRPGKRADLTRTPIQEFRGFTLDPLGRHSGESRNDRKANCIEAYAHQTPAQRVA